MATNISSYSTEQNKLDKYIYINFSKTSKQNCWCFCLIHYRQYNLIFKKKNLLDWIQINAYFPSKYRNPKPRNCQFYYCNWLSIILWPIFILCPVKILDPSWWSPCSNTYTQQKTKGVYKAWRTLRSFKCAFICNNNIIWISY